MSTASATKFVSAKVIGPDGPDDFLWTDSNGKITAGNGTLLEPRPNAFSLVQVKDCPGATPACSVSCYVHNLEKAVPNVHALYVHNSAKIRKILEDELCAERWALVMAAWISSNAVGGFRWHVSGDIFSERYALWIASVCMASAGVKHWIYTRSFSFLSILHPASTVTGGNLSVNISADCDNLKAAIAASEQWKFRICYMTTDGVVPSEIQHRLGSVIFPDYKFRASTPDGQVWYRSLPQSQKGCVCPVDYRGKTERIRCGPCHRCMN
jgi:hypothetical protein